MTPDNTDMNPKLDDGAGYVGSVNTFGSSMTVDGNKVYSPTQTIKYLRCPRLWQLERMGYEPRGVEWNPAKSMGSSIHAGWNAQLKGGNDEAIANAITATLALEYVDNDRYPFDSLVALASRCVGALSGEIPIGEPETLVASERALSEIYGNTIPDLVTRPWDKDPSLTVTQLKTSFKWKPEYWPGRVKEYTTSWQLLHEAWAVQAYYGLPVRMTRVLFVGVLPRPWVKIHTNVVEQVMLEQWYEWARRVWYQMAEDETRGGTIPGDTNRCNDYGQCPMYQICWDLGGDLERAKAFYDVIQRPRAIRPI